MSRNTDQHTDIGVNDPDSVWRHDTLRIIDGRVRGSAYTEPFSVTQTRQREYTVTVSVRSYELGEPYDHQYNHVPRIVVTTIDGTIVAEPSAHDTRHPQTALDTARSTGEAVYNNPHRYID